MKSFSELAKSVVITKKGSSFILNDKDPNLTLIGEGRSAFVFRIGTTDKVLKVFFPEFEKVAREEAEVYRILSGIPYYSPLYGAGKNYLVIDFIEGYTFFSCLEKGIPISTDSLREVDCALGLAREKGLNPSDVHLRNIIITSSGEIKLIDVARFRQTKNCTQWKDLKAAFHKFYKQKYFPKKIPATILNLVALLYKKKLLPALS
ncbi:serine/threonine protein kinase [Peribacillus acanthi]|uniref:serine/threonine protein kinase n=1 Tax=Peribacillus acanthi TaxID=2171554 RepID=UPI000D3E163B|nr:serine/threonine protein kinase [Peribacillus acanthi]